MSAGGFLACHVMDVGSRDAQTAVFARQAARARAVGLDGREVARVRAVAEVDGAGGDDGVAEALRLIGARRVRIFFMLAWGEKRI